MLAIPIAPIAGVFLPRLPTDDDYELTTPLNPPRPIVDLHIAEGRRVVLIRDNDNGTIRHLRTFQLDEFSVVAGVVRWCFKDNEGRLYEGRLTTGATLYRSEAGDLEVVLKSPIILLASKHGLRATFEFRIPTKHHVLQLGVFQSLTGQ